MALVDVYSKERIDIPHEGGSWVELAPLTGAQMLEATNVAAKQAMSQISELDAKFVESIISSRSNQQASNTQDKYDGATLIKYCLVGWSYSEPCDEENKARLDAATYGWLVEEIITRNTHGPL